MDRREFVKGVAVASGGVVLGIVCKDDIVGPSKTARILDVAAVDLSELAYKKWLRQHKPRSVVGMRGSEIDCPTARFAKTQGGSLAVVLRQQHAFAGGPVIANPVWLPPYLKKLDESGEDGSPITRLEAQKLL